MLACDVDVATVGIMVAFPPRIHTVGLLQETLNILIGEFSLQNADCTKQVPGYLTATNAKLRLAFM